MDGTEAAPSKMGSARFIRAHSMEGNEMAVILTLMFFLGYVLAERGFKTNKAQHRDTHTPWETSKDQERMEELVKEIAHVSLVAVIAAADISLLFITFSS